MRSALRMYLRRPVPGREAFSLPMLQTITEGWFASRSISSRSMRSALLRTSAIANRRLAIRKTGISDQTRMPWRSASSSV